MSASVKKKCCVPNCEDRFSKRHRFPRADKDPTLFKLWLEKVQNPLFAHKTPKQIRSYGVCDRHFTDDVKLNSWKGLWKTAVPELFLPGTSMVKASCAVSSCYSSKSSRHRFPNPKIDINRFKNWLLVVGNRELLKRSPDEVYANCRVCGDHFAASDFGSNNILTKSAVPTLNLPSTQESLKIDTVSTGVKRLRDSANDNETFVEPFPGPSEMKLSRDALDVPAETSLEPIAGPSGLSEIRESISFSKGKTLSTKQYIPINNHKLLPEPKIKKPLNIKQILQFHNYCIRETEQLSIKQEISGNDLISNNSIECVEEDPLLIQESDDGYKKLQEAEYITQPCGYFRDYIKNISVLPEFWFYVEKPDGMEFMRIDPTLMQIKNHIRVYDDLSVTVIFSNKEEMPLPERVASSDSIYDYLKSVEEWPQCVGAQIDAPNKKCRGVLIGENAYKMNQTKPRCLSCRMLPSRLLKILLPEKKKKEDETE